MDLRSTKEFESFATALLFHRPIDIKDAYVLLKKDIATLKSALENNGYQINFQSDNSGTEDLFWQELANREKWKLFKLLVENNEHHIEPQKNQKRTILTTLLEKNQTELYLQILNKKFKTGVYSKEDLLEIAGHYRKYRNRFSAYLTNSIYDEFFTVFRILLETAAENSSLSQNDLLTDFEILLLACNKHHAERNDFIKWLLENDRYKSVKKKLNPLFLKAIIGEDIEQLKKIEIYDFVGFTPFDYAVLSGNCQITDRKYFDKKIGERKNITFWEQLLQINAARLIELIIETNHWSLLRRFTSIQLVQIPLPKKDDESFLILLVENKQYELFCKIVELNYELIKINEKRYQELLNIINDAEHCSNLQQIIGIAKTKYPKLSQIISFATARTTSTSDTPTLDIATTALKNTPFESLDSQFAILHYKLSLPAENSIKEQVFFAKLAKLCAENKNWELFKKLIDNNAHHIQPSSGRKETLLTDLAKNNQWDLYFQLLDKFLTEHPDVSREELAEVYNHYNQYRDQMELDDNLTFLRIALHCKMEIPDLLLYLLQKIHDNTKFRKYLIFLLKDDNFQKLDPSIQKDSILACVGSSTKSFDELSKLPKDKLGLRPHHYLILSGNIEPDIHKDLLPSIHEDEKISLLRVALGVNPTYWIKFLIKRQAWEAVKKIIELGDFKTILPTKGKQSFLTELAASKEWNLYYAFVKQHFKLLSSPEYDLRLNEIHLNLLEHPDKGHEVFLLELKSQYPEPQTFYTVAAACVDDEKVAKILINLSAPSTPSTANTTTHSNPDLITLAGYKAILQNMQQVTPTAKNSESQTETKPQQTKKKSTVKKQSPKVEKQSPKLEKQNTEITDADIAEVKAMLTAAFTSGMFSCDCILGKDKSCIITLNGDKTALQLVTTFLKSKSLLKFTSSLLQQPLQENQKPKYKKLITLKTKQDVQLFMAAFAKTDDKDFVELSTKLQTLTPPEESKKQQDAGTSSRSKHGPIELSIDQQNAWIKILSSAFCKNSNFKSLIKWNQNEKCFEVDISSTDWRIKKYKGHKDDYKTYKIDAPNFHRYILHHITNAIDATLIATTKVSSDQKTVKIYFSKTELVPIPGETYDSIFEVFKQHGTLVPDVSPPPPPPPEDSSSKDKKPKESTPNNNNNNNNNAVAVSSVPEILKHLFCQIGGIETQNFAFLRFKQHEKHPNKWILSFSTKQVEQFDQYHSELFFQALKTTFDKHVGFITLFGDKKECRIRFNMAKIPSDFNGLDVAFAREYEKLRFDRLLKILLITSGLLPETNLDELQKEQDKTEIHKWTIHCDHILTEAVAKALCDGLQNATGFVTFTSSNNNNNSTKIVFDTTCTPSEIELKILHSNLPTESPTSKRINESVSPSSTKKIPQLPTEGEVYTALVRIMQHLSKKELKQLKELINLIEELPLLKGDSSLRDQVIQFDLDLYTTRIFWLLAYGEMKYSKKVLGAWDARNLFRHISEEISERDFACIKELFPVLRYLIPFAEAENVSIKIASDKKDTLIESVQKFLAPFSEKLKGRLRQNSPQRSERYEKLACEIARLETDAEITPQRKQHAILQAKSLSGEYLLAPKNSRKLYPKFGHKGFGEEFGIFASRLYRKYVTPATDIQSLRLEKNC